MTRRLAPVSFLLLAAAAPGAAHGMRSPITGIGPPRLRAAESRRVRIWRVGYRAHDGRRRLAYVVLPRWYGPLRDPPIPLVISPHGRGARALGNALRWGALPALGRFAVVNPQGQGRRLELYSWGDPGETADLARMPELVRRALPWLRIDPRRVYAFGGSMGGQETLLLVAHDGRRLAGAASFDAPTNMALRYRDFARMRDGALLRDLARDEIGGTPRTDPDGYADRSPIDDVRRIAYSGVPLQLWWSRDDRVVSDQSRESALLYHEIERLNPQAPVWAFEGTWAHTAEMWWNARLPESLRIFGLLPSLKTHPPWPRLRRV